MTTYDAAHDTTDDPTPAVSRTFDHAHFRVLMDLVQDGVVSRRQLEELGAAPHDIKRMLRRHELHRRLPGVYVEHNGPLTQAQKEWMAIHAHWPCALARESALPVPIPSSVIHVAIAANRTVKPVPRVWAHRTPDIDDRVDWGKAPPRERVEHALIDVASARRHEPLAVFRLLADVVQTKQTTAAQVAAVLRTRRVAGRTVMLEMLDDLALGACSVLEREYLRQVERAHGLPDGRRQAPGRSAGSPTQRDVHYDDHALLVELDGRAFHDNAKARDHDADRDLDARVDDDLTTVRLTYGLVLGSPCRTAARIARLLQRGGWTGQSHGCGADGCHLEP